LLAGLLLETGRRFAKVETSSAIGLAAFWASALAGFALTRSYPVALALLFVAGFCELSFSSMTQTIVQMTAPLHMRGRVLGLFSMSSSGLRTFSGITVGLVGSVATVHSSLFFAASVFVAIAFILFLSSRRTDRAAG
ncbi:MFS transporter, partial [bacterium]